MIDHLPSINALLNTTTVILLLLGYSFIRRKNIRAHRVCMVSAVVTSSLFLAGYLTYHYAHGVTRFQGQGWLRAFYLSVLTSHTIMAAVIVPLVLITLYRAWRASFDRHRRLARVTLPLWLYVSVTGVAIYLMLYHL